MMLPLCGLLGITVNELLSWERLDALFAERDAFYAWTERHIDRIYDFWYNQNNDNVGRNAL